MLHSPHSPAGTDKQGTLPQVRQALAEVARGIVTTVTVVGAIAWVVGVLVAIRPQLRSGGIGAPPMFASTWLFGLGVIVVIVRGASPLHLLGGVPLSLVLGIVVLTFLAGVTSPWLVWVCWPNSNPGRTLRPNADNT